MKKTLYSLVLNDDVVREVDIMAHKMGTNRSSLINRILAEYVNYVTPEQRIGEVLSAIEKTHGIIERARSVLFTEQPFDVA